MAAVEKITIALTAEQAGFVRDAVASGACASTSEAIREGVREWKERHDLLGFTIEELQSLVEGGLDSGPSEHADIEGLKAEARRRHVLARPPLSD